MRARHMVFLVTALIAAACGQGDSAGSSPEMQGMKDGAVAGDAANTPGFAGGVAQSGRADLAAVAPPSAPAPASPLEGGEQLPSQPITPSMVIRTGDARIKVSSVDTAIAQLHELARRVGGYVANSSVQGGEKELRQAMLELKMPADRFPDAAAGLNSLGKVEYVNVTAQDVGEEFVDVTARVENSRRLEQRLIGLLATRTGKLEEVLSVERELARVRETIERYEGRLRYLRTRIAVSTLTVNVHESVPIVGELGTPNRIVEAFRNAWRNFVGFVAAVIESLGVLLPLGLIAFFAGRWVWRNRPKQSGPTPPTTAE